ncbi:HSF-type DNA-binding-domain-containing protein [Umbelopsis sp. AD052]|nr:HSF-type DNA-binding-domain-containing protein [Umbelopsis sp. AD052]
MEHRATSSSFSMGSPASLSIYPHDLSRSSVSPGHSPLLSPYDDGEYDDPLSPTYMLPDSLEYGLTLQNDAPHSPRSPNNTTFVHKLYDMVIDTKYQNLISWSHDGTSFIVCNKDEFENVVLPAHFKHRNFASFVRQLNMYGFHKINKTARGQGQRTSTENNIWKFSHPSFLRDRPDLLDGIKRKAMEQETNRRDANDLSSSMLQMQQAQHEILDKLTQLQSALERATQELKETKASQSTQEIHITGMVAFLQQQFGPLNFQAQQVYTDQHEQPPPIFITSPDSNSAVHQAYYNMYVQTQGLNISRAYDQTHQSPLNSPQPYEIPLPPSPSPSSMMSDDEHSYSPHSPMASNNNTMFRNVDGRQGSTGGYNLYNGGM